MGPEELYTFIKDRLETKMGFSRTDLISNLVAELQLYNITEIPQFNSIEELVKETNENHSELEKLIHKHIKRNQMGRGEAWCLLTIPQSIKAKRITGCDSIIDNKRYEFKEQKKDIRFYNNAATMNEITCLRKNLYIIDRALTHYYSHELTIEWNAIGIMDKPNELNESKLRALGNFLVKLKQHSHEFKFDKWFSDAIDFENFTYDSFAEKIKTNILKSFDGIVIVDEDKYYLIDTLNNENFRFTRITIGEPKFVLTTKKSLLSSPSNDASSSIGDSVSEQPKELRADSPEKPVSTTGCDGGNEAKRSHSGGCEAYG